MTHLFTHKMLYNACREPVNLDLLLTVFPTCHCSEKGRFSYGFASCAGKRASMEDFYETRVDDVDGETVGLFGVFDGMGCCVPDLLLFVVQGFHMSATP